MRSLRADADVQAAIKRAASDEQSRGFAAVLRALEAYDDERPADKQQIVGPVEVRVSIRREGTRRS